MAKPGRDFFKGKEVLFVGYSAKNNQFSKMVYQAFMDNGMKVYPLNNKADSSYDIKVYNKLADLPKIPENAYVLLNRENAKSIVGTLAKTGVKRVLFQNKKNVDADILQECQKQGMETAVACPMMIYGKGMHKIHAFFAGVR